MILRLCHVLILSLLCAQVEAKTLTGKVVRVLAGDTVEVLTRGTTLDRIRLAGIDAPETKQDFGTRAKQKLLALAGGQTVEVDWQKRDRYSRIVGKLIAGGQDLNLAMVRSGLAWWYRQYATEQSTVDQGLYRAAEEQARADKVWVWIDPAPMAPWDWRHQPEPAGGYAAQCPCGSGAICTGKRGGRFCVRPSGAKRYQRLIGICAAGGVLRQTRGFRLRFDLILWHPTGNNCFPTPPAGRRSAQTLRPVADFLDLHYSPIGNIVHAADLRLREA